MFITSLKKVYEYCPLKCFNYSFRVWILLLSVSFYINTNCGCLTVFSAIYFGTCCCGQSFPLTVCPEAMLEIAKQSSENGKTFSMNLSAPFLCSFFKKPMLELMPYVDILFGNESVSWYVWNLYPTFFGSELRCYELLPSQWSSKTHWMSHGGTKKIRLRLDRYFLTGLPKTPMPHENYSVRAIDRYRGHLVKTCL